MAKIEPFEKHTERYENWFVKNRYAYQSEVRAIKEILPDFKDGSFDLVLMVTTLCFLDDVKKAFSEVYRILKPGGFLLMDLWIKIVRLEKSIKKISKKVFFTE